MADDERLPIVQLSFVIAVRNGSDPENDSGMNGER